MIPKKRDILPNDLHSRISYEQNDAVEQLANQLLLFLPAGKPQAIVIACIGTDRSTGDSLGPLVGSFLSKKLKPPFFVYGTLEEPIHAVNLQEKAEKIKEMHPHALFIAVDACLGKVKSVGTIQVIDGPLKPGAGVHKKLPEIGDFHITGIVNISGFMEFVVLQNTRLNLVLKMAKTISDGILLASRKTSIQNGHLHSYWPSAISQQTEKADYN
ncbi:spore protease YyaC [Bacillus sp. 1P06AnD]|uniref:spore protease YyaC n=1 Tax=Bacillus sp. 1P06AnD TaxID=3132208 RepID=UPI0039A23C9D